VVEIESSTAFLRLFGIHIGQFHDEVTVKKIYPAEKKEPPELKDGDEIRFPGSMTIVVPAQQILTLMGDAELKAKRDARFEAAIAADLANRKRGAVVLESKVATSTALESNNPAHKEDFTSLLNAAAKTPAKGD
jgi:hypothetical protein